MIDYEEVLSNEQQDICFSNKNLLVKACPGSGKTRTITYKLAHRIEENPDKVKKLVAITYTNRAAEEIEERIENLGINTERIWTGTIHQFCIEWILKRYRMYTNSLKKGFKIIDERVTERYITSIISYYHYNLHWKNIDTGYDRNLRLKEKSTDKKRVIKTYHALLKRNTELDFEQILVTAFNLLKHNPFMANNIRDTIELICIDEYQDTRDLQYAIVEEIANANSNSGFEVNFYGDPNQAIYGSIGGVAKSLAEINNEFSTLKFQECTLNGCYRSTQRIINYYLPYMIENYSIIAKGSNCALKGIIDYNNKLYKDYLSDAIAEIVQSTLNDGIPENEICIIAPEWGLIYPFSRELQEKLPDISFDAPDITPIKRDNMNIFYKISKLLLTDPSIKKIGSRCKLATEILEVLEQYSGRLVEYSILEFLNIINTFRNQSTENIGSKDDIYEILFGDTNYINNLCKRSLVNICESEYIRDWTQRLSYLFDTFDGIDPRNYNKEKVIKLVFTILAIDKTDYLQNKQKYEQVKNKYRNPILHGGKSVFEIESDIKEIKKVDIYLRNTIIDYCLKIHFLNISTWEELDNEYRKQKIFLKL